MPLYEIIRNSIHTIDEAKVNELIDNRDKIRVELIRNGTLDTLARQNDTDY